MTTTRGPVDPSDASALLREVARLHVRAQRETLACDGARAVECTILTELGRAPALTLAQLARRLRVDKGWTSRAVDQLLAANLLEKSAVDSDRRTFTISLTRAGRDRHRWLEAVLNEQVARVIERIPRAERAAVGRALRTLHEAYVAELASVEAGPTPVEGSRSCATR